MINYFRIFRFCSAKLDPYIILGVKKGTSMKLIKDAYIAMCKKYHPDLNSSEDAKVRFAEIHEAYLQLKQQKFYEQVEEDFKQNYYSAQSEEECFKSVFGFYFYENPQEYYKPENSQKRADYQDLLRKYKTKQKSESEKPQHYDVKINRMFDSSSLLRSSDHTMLRVLLMLTIVISVTSAYVFFYKRKTTFAKNTLTDCQIMRMKTLSLIREQKRISDKQNQI